jgi:fatty-acyl-CoA synthase
VSVIHGKRQYKWKETYARCRRLASALAKRGIGAGDAVAVMLQNTPEMYEAHFGVPMTGGVLLSLNTRLDAEAIGFMLAHGGAKVLITDREFSPTVKGALAKMKTKPEVIDVDDPEYSGPGERLGAKTYEQLLAEGDPAYAWRPPSDEWNAISLNYTSGTTGDPKGVVYHHRGAYLNAVCNIVTWGMPQHAVYLWTLPMFHCNGWCFAWTMAANAGTNVCLRKVDAGLIFSLIKEHGITHYCGAPIVHSALIGASEEMRRGIKHKVHGMVAAAAPPASMIEGMEKLGLRQAGGMERARRRRAHAAERPPGRALPDGGGTRRDGPGDDAAGARGRRDHGRDHVPRQHHDEGLPEESGGLAEGLRGRLVSFRRPRREVS